MAARALAAALWLGLVLRVSPCRRPTRRSRAGSSQLFPAAQQLGVSRATFDAATRGLEPDLTLPDLVIPGRPDRQPSQAEFVQTPARVSEGVRVRQSRRAGAQARRTASRDADEDRAALRRAGLDRAGDLGARDQLRRGEAAAQRDPRARDAGLSRPAQGAVPRGVPARAEDAAGRAMSRSPACARPGRARWGSRSFCLRASTNTRSISTATAGAMSGPRCRTCSARSRTIWSSSAGSAASAGPTRCARRAAPIAPSRSPA